MKDIIFNALVGSISTTEENATGCSSDQKNNRGLTDLENELSVDVDKSENDPLIVSPPTEEIEHNTNSSPNLLSGKRMYCNVIPLAN